MLFLLHLGQQNASGMTTFAIIDTKLYVPVVNLSIQDNGKLLQQLKSSFKGTVNWNKYPIKSNNTDAKPISKLFNFFDINRLFVLLIENNW